MSSDEDTTLIYSLGKEKHSNKDWNVTIKMGKQNTTFKIDTGAQCNIMSMETYKRISSQPLLKSHTKLITFGGHRITSSGKTHITREYK